MQHKRQCVTSNLGMHHLLSVFPGPTRTTFGGGRELGSLLLELQGCSLVGSELLRQLRYRLLLRLTLCHHLLHPGN